MRLLIINNLASGARGGTIYDFMRCVAADGDEVVMRTTDGTSDLRTFLTDADQFDVVVASGGDGTVSTIAYVLAYSGVPLLPYPSGTANLVCSNLMSPTEPHALAKLVREGLTLDFDLGEIDIAGNRYGFGLTSGAGYDAIIMQNANPNKRAFGPLAYFNAAVANATPAKSTITLVIDGETVVTEGIGVLLINFSKIQFDLSITHNNLPRDGILDIAVLKCSNAFELIPAIGAAMLDIDGEFPSRTDALEFFQGREVSISCDPPLDIQYDGEVTNQKTPFSARILPRATRLILSEDARSLYLAQSRD